MESLFLWEYAKIINYLRFEDLILTLTFLKTLAIKILKFSISTSVQTMIHAIILVFWCVLALKLTRDITNMSSFIFNRRFNFLNSINLGYTTLILWVQMYYRSGRSNATKTIINVIYL